MGLKLNKMQITALAENIKSTLAPAVDKQRKEIIKLWQISKEKKELESLEKEYQELEKQQKEINKKIGNIKQSCISKFKCTARYSSFYEDEIGMAIKGASKEDIEQAIILESIGADDVKSITEAVIKKFNK